MALDAGVWGVVGDGAPGTSVVQYAGMGIVSGAVPAVMNDDQPSHEEGVETVRRFLMEAGVPESLFSSG